MPDLTTHTTLICKTNEYWQMPVKSTSQQNVMYMVKFEQLPPGASYEYGYTCTCKAFTTGKKRGQECKHIQSVKHRRCAWNETMELLGEKDAQDKCPRCQGPLIPVRVAV